MLYLPLFLVLIFLVTVATYGCLLALVPLRRRYPTLKLTLITAIILNVLGLAVPVMGYTAWFLILVWCAFIAAVVAAVSLRWSWFAGLLASPWFLVPWLVWNTFTQSQSPDYIAAYGYIPWGYIGFAVACGCIGATLGTIIHWLNRRYSVKPNIAARDAA